MESAPSSVGLLLSGGLDSAILLDHLLATVGQVTPFYIQTDCLWRDCERAAVHSFLEAMACPALKPLVEFEMPVADLYGTHWSLTGLGVPSDSTPDDAVFLPGRNPLLLVKPMLWCASNGIDRLALATLLANPFNDATPNFFARFEEAMQTATGSKVELSRPFERMAKSRVMQLGRHLPLHFTFSCIAPRSGLHCGQCNKCEERRRAFASTGILDQTKYALDRSRAAAQRPSH